ncbi:potassium-transporting ATPase subunit C, partial [Herminiimonas sp.]|uniref:potassium-transporting ATPase subunit C n=1 Tax=Herminiimonas sp. TaxID=1926289 RepID=UPI002726FCD1
MNATFRPALVLFAVLTLICGVIYPYAITSIGKLAFSDQAQGSLVSRNGQLVGSSLIGQAFSSPQYFWGRPSATGPMPNNATASSGANQGPLNPALIDNVK